MRRNDFENYKLVERKLVKRNIDPVVPYLTEHFSPSTQGLYVYYFTYPEGARDASRGCKTNINATFYVSVSIIQKYNLHGNNGYAFHKAVFCTVPIFASIKDDGGWTGWYKFS